MTTPSPTTFTPRVLGDVDAMLVEGTDEQIEDIREWIRSLPAGYTVAVPSFMNRSTISVVKSGFSLTLWGGQYAVWDGLGLRAADKLAFELIYSSS